MSRTRSGASGGKNTVPLVRIDIAKTIELNAAHDTRFLDAKLSQPLALLPLANVGLDPTGRREVRECISRSVNHFCCGLLGSGLILRHGGIVHDEWTR